MNDRAEPPAGAGYRVLARKYRPRTFAELIGQDAMVRTLANAFSSGRIAQAYMLTGVRGVGKTTTARLIARALNYARNGEGAPALDMPDYGDHCLAILESRHIDVVEMDAASRTGIDDIRDIIEQVRYRPVEARYKVFIIDEVHMLSKQAFNALLKTLEEPPPHVKFVFATTEIRKVPVTVLSRCQRFDLKRLDAALLMQHFGKVAEAEGASAEEGALRLIARAAEGSVRDGLSLLDQAIAHGGGSVTAAEVQSMLGLSGREQVIDLFERLMAGDAAGALAVFGELHDHGGDPHTLLADLAEFVHFTTKLKVVPALADDIAFTQAERERGRDLAGRLAMAHLTRGWQMLLKGLGEVALAGNALAAAEMVLIRLAYAASLPSPEDLARAVESGPSAPPAAPRPVPPAAPSRPAPVAVERPAPAVAPAPPPEAPPAPPPWVAALPAPSPSPSKVASFRDLVALAGEHRDIKLKSSLEQHVRFVRMAPGKLEIALEPMASPSLPGEIARRLEAWTGERWMVIVSREGGEPPLAAQAKAHRRDLFLEARDHPAVKAIFERFPDAEILDVRQGALPAADEDSDQPEGGTGAA